MRESPKLDLTLLHESLAVCRLPSQAAIPDWATGTFVAITRTPDELSIVCAADAVPDAVRSEGPWRAFVVAGPLDFALTGILAAIAGPLAEAGVPIFAISTFDTDYVLVRAADVNRAIEALRAAGHRVRESWQGEVAEEYE
jgi:uncharacterized protein